MSLVTSKDMLVKARKEGYAVGAFNAENMEMVKAIIKAAERVNAPVIIQTTPSTVKYASSAMYAAMVRAEAELASVPVAVHLDHGNSYELAVECMKNGYTSIMIDGSRRELQGNIEITKKVIEEAKKYGVPVEAELGKVGGKEDDLEVKVDTNTDVTEAVEFVEKTGVDILAIAIGTAHGFYVGTPVLDKERLSQIAKVVHIPLVLHGASGISDEEVSDCVRRGISKVNFATELRVAYTDAMKKLVEEAPTTFDPKAFGKVSMEAVTNLVANRMKVCGCQGKAN